MIDTTRYAGHTPAPWGKVRASTGLNPGGRYFRIDLSFYDKEQDEILANLALIEDAPLLIEEIMLLRKNVQISEIERLREQARIAEAYLDAMANPMNRINSPVAIATEALAAMKAAGGE